MRGPTEQVSCSRLLEDLRGGEGLHPIRVSGTISPRGVLRPRWPVIFGIARSARRPGPDTRRTLSLRRLERGTISRAGTRHSRVRSPEAVGGPPSSMAIFCATIRATRPLSPQHGARGTRAAQRIDLSSDDIRRDPRSRESAGASQQNPGSTARVIQACRHAGREARTATPCCRSIRCGQPEDRPGNLNHRLVRQLASTVATGAAWQRLPG